MIEHVLVDYVRLLSQERFQHVDFSLVREHIPFIGEITFSELIAAVETYKKHTPPYLYSTPNLAYVIPYIIQTMRQRDHPLSLLRQNGYSIKHFSSNNLDSHSGTKSMTGVVSLQSEDTDDMNNDESTQERRQSQANCFMKCDRDIFDPEDESTRDNNIDEE